MLLGLAEADPNKVMWNICVCIICVCDYVNAVCTSLLYLFNYIVLTNLSTIRDAVDPKGLYFNT